MPRRLLVLGLLGIALAALVGFLLGDGKTRGEPVGVERERPEVATPVLTGRALVEDVVPAPPVEGGEGTASPSDAEGTEPKEPDASAILARYAGWVRGNAIEGVVLRGLEPIGEGTAYLFRAQSEGGTGPWDAVGSAQASALISRAGTFRFEGLEAGTYYVGVQVPGVSMRVVGQRIREDRPERPRLILLLGTGGIHGRVFDEEGRLAVGVPVRVGSTAGLGSGVARVLTDGEGRYRVGDLPGSGYWVQVHLAGDAGDAKDTRQRQVVLGAGQELRVDFGTEAGDPLFSGTVRTAWGAPIRGPAQLVLARDWVEECAVIPYDEEGRFAQRVPAGSYTVVVWFRGLDPLRTTALSEGVTIRDAILRRDLVVPGTRVYGEVRGGPPPDLQISWEAQGAGAHTRHTTRVLPDRTWLIDGIAPGIYVVRGFPNDLVGADGAPVEFEVREGDSEIRVDLEVRAPKRR